MKFLILIPLYRSELMPDEIISIRQLSKVYPEHPKMVVKPKSVSLPRELEGIGCCEFDRDFFDGTDGYNNLLLSKEFYMKFTNWDYILIYQLDCLIFREDIEKWCQKGWSYIGAPWFREFWDNPKKGLWKTGNGGFSLRSVKDAVRVLDKKVPPGTMRGAMERASVDYFDRSNPSNHLRKTQEFKNLESDLLLVEQDLHRYPLNEDIFWSFEAERLDDSFNVPSAKEALSFAFEKAPRWSYRHNWWKLPTGCHAWAKEGRQFWMKFISI